jgi:hypothetical protein
VSARAQHECPKPTDLTADRCAPGPACCASVTRRRARLIGTPPGKARRIGLTRNVILVRFLWPRARWLVDRLTSCDSPSGCTGKRGQDARAAPVRITAIGPGVQVQRTTREAPSTVALNERMKPHRPGSAQPHEREPTAKSRRNFHRLFTFGDHTGVVPPKRGLVTLTQSAVNFVASVPTTRNTQHDNDDA